MAVLSPTNPLDPVTGLPNGAVLKGLVSTPETPALSHPPFNIVSAPQADQLVNLTTGHTV